MELIINPSAHGWIGKFFSGQKTTPEMPVAAPEAFYGGVRENGFILGHIISFYGNKPINTDGWLKEEISKGALLNILYEMHRMATRKSDPEEFIADAVGFYNAMHPQGFSIFRKVFSQGSALQLEEI